MLRVTMRRHQTPSARWPAQGPQVTRITARCWADDGGFFRVSGMRDRWHVWQASVIASRSAPLALAAAENHRPGLSVSRNLPESHLGLEVLPKNSKRKNISSPEIFLGETGGPFAPVGIWDSTPSPTTPHLTSGCSLPVNLSGRPAVHIRATVPMLLLVSDRPCPLPMLLEP